jgi:short-subunit dehydrogenase
MMNATVVITGASAGIGRALAFEFASRGYNLGLTARRLNVLEQLRAQILATPGCGDLRIELACFDVAEESTVSGALRAQFAALGGVDIVMANAGINDVTHVGQGDFVKECRLIRTNVIGAIATVDAAVEHFLARGCGHVVGISSLASLQPMREQAAYCASKAAFSMYLKAARHDLKGKNIVVTDILPGYVKTDIVDGVDIGKLPFAISVEQAAREITTLVEKRVERGIVPAFPWAFLRPFFGHVPQRFLRL